MSVVADDPQPTSDGAKDGDGKQGANVNPLDSLKEFKLSFWILTICCLAVYGCVLPFNNVASSLLMERSYFKPNPDGCYLTSPHQCEPYAYSEYQCLNAQLGRRGKTRPQAANDSVLLPATLLCTLLLLM